MSSLCVYTVPLLLLLLNILTLQIHFSHAQTLTKVSAVFVFGDSTVDPGNNNYIPTIARGNFSPYGKDFVNHMPTGRFSNGRLVTDIVASFLGVKEYVPPYLDQSLIMEDLMTGVSFASSGSGYDPLTAKESTALTMSQQLDLFKDYKARLEGTIGKERTDDLINRAAFVVSAGTNDFSFNYFGAPIRSQTYPTVASYCDFLWQNIKQFLQDLVEEGAKKIGVVGVPPIGCLPSMITVHSDNPISHRQCIQNLNSVSTDYNDMLQTKLQSLQQEDTKIVYADIYTPIINMVQNQGQFGLEEVNIGCCGTGLVEADFLCNAKSPLCSDASKYVFWDSFHPTERGYYIIFYSLQSFIQENLA